MIYCIGRLENLDKEAGLPAESQEYKQIVGLLCCFHGIDTLTAITIITEIFEFGRFESPSHLMSYPGLTLSEDSSGDRQKKGAITKAGNKRSRRLLNETSWHYRHRYVPSAALKKRRKGQPQRAIEIADAAGRRLSKRHRYLINKGKTPCKANWAQQSYLRPPYMIGSFQTDRTYDCRTQSLRRRISMLALSFKDNPRISD
jgi:transposase